MLGNNEMTNEIYDSGVAWDVIQVNLSDTTRPIVQSTNLCYQNLKFTL